MIADLDVLGILGLRGDSRVLDAVIGLGIFKISQVLIETVLVALELCGKNNDRVTLFLLIQTLANPFGAFKVALPLGRKLKLDELVGKFCGVAGGRPKGYQNEG
jgi:hypothetical protein